MQIEITLTAPKGADHSARDLGYLLHKHPDHVHRRSVSAGEVIIFFTEATETRATAVIYLDVDPVGLVRGRGSGGEGLLDQYVNDRPYAANSLLSVALGRAIGQTLAGKSKERPDLAARALPVHARVTPLTLSGSEEMVQALFEPLGYRVGLTPLDAAGQAAALELDAEIRLADLMTHLQVLIPVLDNAKHYWVDQGEIETLLSRGDGWLDSHPARELILRRALKHRRDLTRLALARLQPDEPDSPEQATETAETETRLEGPLRLHDQRLDTVISALSHARATSVLDLGCGEGRLLQRLAEDRSFQRVLGVDMATATLARARRRLRLDEPGRDTAERVSLQTGSLTYGDRRWRGFDAATLVEVIEHVDADRLPSLVRSVFGDARPATVLITTPNREHNRLFPDLPEGQFRHPDHRFEWTRAEFRTFTEHVAETHGYSTEISGIGQAHPEYGPPTQMAVFSRLEEAA